MARAKPNLLKGAVRRFDPPNHMDYPVNSLWTRGTENGRELYVREADKWKYIGRSSSATELRPKRYIYRPHPKDIPFVVLSPL